jgi:hypothetical protein
MYLVAEDKLRNGYSSEPTVMRKNKAKAKQVAIMTVASKNVP